MSDPTANGALCLVSTVLYIKTYNKVDAIISLSHNYDSDDQVSQFEKQFIAFAFFEETFY